MSQDVEHEGPATCLHKRHSLKKGSPNAQLGMAFSKNSACDLSGPVVPPEEALMQWRGQDLNLHLPVSRSFGSWAFLTTYSQQMKG